MDKRVYIEYDNARITRKEGILLDVEMYDGLLIENVEARRLFPLTGLTRYITLLDEEGLEKAVIRNLSNLMDESREIIEAVLSEYYLVPKIDEIKSIEEKHRKLIFDVVTDNGPHSFEVRHVQANIKQLYDGRVLIKDDSDNRYEIPDLHILSKSSLLKLSPYL